MKEGLIQEIRYSEPRNLKALWPYNLKRKIWFKDSCVIYEVKGLFGNSIEKESGKYQKDSFCFFKYTYLDLRTRSCQDYYQFSDTAMPVCNYILKHGETINWNFYEKVSSNLKGKITMLPDTIIENRTYRRITLRNYYKDSLGYEYTYYLDCNSKKHIFHINRSIDDMYPSCQITRSVLQGDLNKAEKTTFNINILEKKLNAKEKNIFKQWAKNQVKTQLPVISFFEAQKKSLIQPYNINQNIDSIQYRINEK